MPNKKPRNHVVLAALKRQGNGAGSHGKSAKAFRRADKIALQKGEVWS